MTQLLLPFEGEHRRILDRKGRFVVPPPWKPCLVNGAVLTRATGGLLALMPEPAWGQLCLFHDAEPEFLGFYLSGAHRLRLQGNGPQESSERLQIPYALREYADLEPFAEVALAGIGRCALVGRADRLRGELVGFCEERLMEKARAAA